MLNFSLKWFPILFLLTPVIMPKSVLLTPVPMITTPLVLAIWMSVVSYRYDLLIPKYMVYLLGLIFASQILLLLSGGVRSIQPMLLGLVWSYIAVLLWSAMKLVDLRLFLNIFLSAALLWLSLAFAAWLNLELDGSGIILFDVVAMTYSSMEKIQGSFTNGNVFAILMLSAWCVSTGLAFVQNKMRVVYLTMSLVFLTLMFSADSRGALISWVIILIILSIGLLKRQEKWKLFWLLVSCIVAWFVAASLVLYTSENIYHVNIAQGDMLEPGLRPTLYVTVFEIWKENWLLGVGFGNIDAHFISAQSRALEYLPLAQRTLGATKNAHNHLLQMMAEVGLVGIITWLAISFFLFKFYLSNLFKINTMTWWMLSAAMVLWIQGLFNISMFEPMPFFLFVAFFGLGYWDQKPNTTGMWIIKSHSYYVMFTGSLVMILCVYSVLMTKNMILYDAMFRSVSYADRGKIIPELLEYQYTYPRVVRQISLDIAHSPSRSGRLKDFQPQILEALEQEEWPVLYRALFYTYVQQEDFRKACELGKFIEKMRWYEDKNRTVYQDFCQGIVRPEVYLLD